MTKTLTDSDINMLASGIVDMGDDVQALAERIIVLQHENDRLREAIHGWAVAERAVQAAQDIDDGMAATEAVVLAGGRLLRIDAALTPSAAPGEGE